MIGTARKYFGQDNSGATVKEQDRSAPPKKTERTPSSDLLARSDCANSLNAELLIYGHTLTNQAPYEQSKKDDRTGRLTIMKPETYKKLYISIRKKIWIFSYNSRIAIEHTAIKTREFIDDLCNPPILIEAYGDSTTEGAIFDGAFVTAQPEKSEPWAVCRILKERHSIKSIVYNYGVGGAQAVELLLGINNFKIPWQTRMENSKASAVLINFAHNDYFFNAQPEPGRLATPADEFENHMIEICEIALRSGKQVFVQEPNPSKPWGDAPPLIPYVEAIDAVSKKTEAVVIPQFYRLQEIEGWEGMLSDTVHPSEEMYLLKADETARTLADHLKPEPPGVLLRLKQFLLRTR